MHLRLFSIVGVALAGFAAPAAAQVYKMLGTPDPMTVYTVSTLPTSGVPIGAVVYVMDCRAVASGLAAVGTQAAGAGTGCLATLNGAGAWQVAGTNITVAK